MKLAGKLALGYVITLLLVGTLGFVSIEVSTRSVTSTAGELASRLAHEMMRRINYGIYLKLDELRLVSAAPVLQNSLAELDPLDAEGEGDARTDAPQEMTAFLRSSLIEHYERSRGYRLFHGGRITDTEGNTVVTVGRGTSLLQLDRTLGTDVLVSPAGYDAETGVSGIPIHVAIRESAGGRRVGVLHVVLSLTALTREIELATTETVGSRVELMNGEGNVLYATTPFRLFTQADGAAYAGRMSQDYGYFTEHEGARSTLRAYARSTGYSSFAGLDWTLMLSQPLEAVTEESRTVQNVMLGVSALILVGVILVSLVVARSITRPIERLRMGAGALAGGDLSHRVGIKSGDEIGELSQAFDDMAGRLEGLYQELEDFAYIVSHDLREPLRGIRFYTDRLQEDWGSVVDSEGQEQLASISRLSNRLNSLIESLLRYSRAGRFDLDLEENDLNEVVQEIHEDLALYIAERNAEVRVPQTLPTVKCDRASVGEVFRNLVTNAIKYNDSDTPLCEIGFRGDPADPVLFVRDNGVGIPEEKREEVFAIFRRLHPHGGYGEGTGSGLTIVKRLVERHNGTIWVEPSSSGGTVFCFTLGGKDQHGAQ